MDLPGLQPYFLNGAHKMIDQPNNYCMLCRLTDYSDSRRAACD